MMEENSDEEKDIVEIEVKEKRLDKEEIERIRKKIVEGIEEEKRNKYKIEQRKFEEVI